MGRVLACTGLLLASMPSLLPWPTGYVSEEHIRTLSAIPTYVQLLAAVEQICRYEMWPKYRIKLDEMVREGKPPKFYRKRRPWASVIYMAATDEN